MCVGGGGGGKDLQSVRVGKYPISLHLDQHVCVHLRYDMRIGNERIIARCSNY